MKTAAEFYPELDLAQVEETIVPLAKHDSDITALLAAPSGDTAHARPTPDRSTRAVVAAWIDRPEEYPFQRLVRAASAKVVDHTPLHGRHDVFADPREALVQVLEMTEARLRGVHARPLVAALNRARKSGVLAGATPADRYDDFVERSLASSQHALSGMDFPVLRDVVDLVVRNAARSTRETCERLRADRADIAEAFGILPDDPVVSLGASAGDTHHHGRSVSVLSFRSGARLVYKPRDVSGEAAYRTVSTEFNTRLGTALPSARVLEREGYGYVEHVVSEDVSDILRNFTRASGELAAVLYLLDARDMHFENVLPTRRGPLPIDLETVLHPDRLYTGPAPETPGHAHSVIDRSVYGIGLLPLVMAGKDPGSGHVDYGFLGGEGSGRTPFKSMTYENPFTDEMRLVLRAWDQKEAGTRKSVLGTLTQQETQDLGEAMAEGFTSVYEAVRLDPAPWRDLLVRSAARLRVRYVHNPTSVYGQALRMTAGANPMDSPEVYTALLKRVALPSRSAGGAIVRSEMLQLAERDVPYFSLAATSTTLEDGGGRPVGAELAQSPLDRTLEKLDGLSEDDLARQRALIHSAFAARFPDNHLASATRKGDDAPSWSGIGTGSSVRALSGILADRLAKAALPDRFDHLPRTWVGPIVSARADRPWPPGVLGYDLYTGRTGIALALAVFARVLGRPDHGALAAQILSSIADTLAAEPHDSDAMRRLGWNGYTGVAGILFCLVSAGHLLGRQDWIRVARDSVPMVTAQTVSLDARSTPLDVIDGIAGVLPVLAAVGGPHEEPATVELVDRLLDGLSRGGGTETLDQSGFAHGVSGLVHALSSVYHRLPEDRRPATERALEQLVDRLGEFHVPERDNWFSNVRDRASFPTGWCHGSAGIALGLNSLHRLTGDRRTAELREAAVRNTLRDGFGRNLTWCHGDLGNHAILRELARSPELSWLSGEITAIEERRLNTDVIEAKLGDARSRYAHTPSLMVGTSGVLLHLLHRIDPTSVPSLATLTLGAESAV